MQSIYINKTRTLFSTKIESIELQPKKTVIQLPILHRISVWFETMFFSLFLSLDAIFSNVLFVKLNSSQKIMPNVVMGLFVSYHDYFRLSFLFVLFWWFELFFLCSGPICICNHHFILFFSLARWADSIVPETMQWNNCGLWKYLAMEITFADHTHSIIWIKCKATWMKLIMATASKSFDSLIVFEKLELCDRCYQYCLIQEKNAKIVVFDCISQCLFANGSKLFLY